MTTRILMLALAVLGTACAFPLELQAQQGEEEQERIAASVALVYEREIFTYRGDSRRDPFRPLTEDNAMGPQFESLSLQGIIYSTSRGNSMVLLADSEGRVYRVRVGDRVGNSRVIEISPTRVVLAVENFGSVRQEMLELPPRGGTP